MVNSLNSNTDYFDIVAGVLQGNTLVPFLFLIYLDDILWMSIDQIKENSCALKNTRRWWYPSETITDADYADNLALLANTLALVKNSQGHGLYMTSDKTEFICFNQNGAISSFNDQPLKLVNHFTHLNSNITSTENNINICIGKT